MLVGLMCDVKSQLGDAPKMQEKINQAKTLYQKGFAYSKKNKIDEIKITGSLGVAKRLVVENGEFTLAQTIESQGHSITVHMGQKKGSASINILDENSLYHAIDEAKTIASFSLVDENLVMSHLQNAPANKKLSFLVDEKIPGVPMETLMTKMEHCLQTVLTNPLLALERFELGTSFGASLLANSHGVMQSEMQTTIGWDYLGMGREGETVSGMDYDSGFSYHFDQLDQKMLPDMKKFVERVIESIHPHKAVPYKGPVLFGPRAFKSVFLGTIAYHMSGRSIMDGKSKWDKKLGETISVKNLNIMDDPHHHELHGSTSFDADGLLTQKRTIIENGILREHYHDLYSAKKTGAKAQGVAGGPFNWIIKNGNDSLKILLQSQNNLLWVGRFSGNVDGLTGDYSGVAKSAKMILPNGETVPVGEVMIAGNALTGLNQIIGISQETECLSGSFISPHVLVDGVTVS